MRAGSLRHSALFQRKTDVPDGMGGNDGVWVDQFTQRCRLKHLRQKESVEAGGLQAIGDAEIKLRASSNAKSIETSWRVIVEGDTYNIRGSFDPSGLGREIMVTLERGVVT